MRLWLAIFMACIVLPARAATPVLMAADGRGHPLVNFLEFLEDPGQKMTLAEVRSPAASARFTPLPSGGDVNFGYSRSAFWLRFTVQPRTDTAWLLEAAFPSLDQVDVFAPDSRGGWERQSGGDLRPFSERPYPHRNLVFPLPLGKGEARTVYLRVVSDGTLTIPLTLWAAEAFHSHDRESYALLSLYFGMLLALMLYNLLLWLSLRDPLFSSYVLFVAGMAVAQASMNGLGNQFLWPDWPAWGNISLPSGMALTGLFGALFTRRFLETRRTVPALDKAILALAGVFALGAASPLLVPYRDAAILVSLTGTVFSAVAVSGAVVCLLRGHPGARYFLLAWSLLLVGVAALGLRNLNWLPTNWFTTYAMQIGSALEMLLLSFALADRINVLRAEKELANAQALEAKQAMVDGLKRSEQELEDRIRERTRALADANARLTHQEQQLRSLVHHDPLTGLANRVLLYDRIELALAHSRRKGLPVAVLLIDLDAFKPVNDAWGHAVGDRLLVEVARRLSSQVRATDTVARLGGDEFVVVLHELQDGAEALQVADKLVRELARPFQTESADLQISASIGVAIHPRHGEDVQSLMRQADQAMYQAKRDGRGTFRVAGSNEGRPPKPTVVSA